MGRKISIPSNGKKEQIPKVKLNIFSKVREKPFLRKKLFPPKVKE